MPSKAPPRLTTVALSDGGDPNEDDPSDDVDWDLVGPDEEEPYPEPGDFWIDDDDWDEAA